MSITQNTPIEKLKGIGEKTAALYAKKELFTAGDVLSFYPRDYEFYTEPVTVDQLKPGTICAVYLTVIGNGSTVRAGRFKITSFRAGDETGQIRITYFNMPFIQKSIRAGSSYVFRGRVRQYKNGNLQLEQPASYTPAEYESLNGKYLPKYSLSQGMKNKQISRLVGTILNDFIFPDDYLSEKDRKELHLPDQKNAIENIHFPESKENLISARNRLVFDEFLSFIVSVRKQKSETEALKNSRPLIPTADTKRLLEKLPYELTASQKNAWEEIENDLSDEYVMNRLLQGDVGSGKTIIAFLALTMCASNKRQGALMAPTEVLAQQHMQDLTEMVKSYDLPIRPILLTGSVKGAARKKAYEQIASGEANVVIGTHALIQEKVEYHDLALVITDEQHRFGVRQRETLAAKGSNIAVLVMSATPIPRTLSIILYGDLKVSRLTELPKNRLPIKNLASSAADRGKILRFMLKQIAEGRQAYIICPAVEEGELEGIENVADYTENLREALPKEIRIESLNGKMKPSEKNRIMNAFASHEIDVLVSTTVIEVGINVPNSTVIIIENAERFGLSQLHQLRGRVGRGQYQSYCIFLYSEEISAKPKRLEILEHSNDGFFIAEEDLKLRGPGDLFGVRQSGEMGFVLADIYEDAGTMNKAAAYADRILKEGRESELYASLSGLKSVDFRSI